MQDKLSQTFSFKSKKTDITRAVSCCVLPDLPWYGWWLRNQLALQPDHMFECLPGFDGASERNLSEIIFPLCLRVADTIASSDAPSIDSVVGSLLQDGSITAGDDYLGLDSAIELVFAILGWQTMLYRPDTLSCPDTEFCIEDEMDGHRGEGHMSLKQNRMATSKPLSDFLLGFGLMLPPPNHHVLDDAEEIKMYGKLKSVEPSTLNAFLLTSIGGIGIEWTDSLACHLELDKDSRLLYLFRYPSFCWSSLKDSVSIESGKPIIYSCASKAPGMQHWGAEQDVTELMGEILLSYRLLFGQNVRSRKMLQKLSPFEGMPLEARDRVLAQLCTKKEADLPSGITERDTYELTRDFSHLRARLVRLNTYLNQRKPRSWTELWLDNRDSASWLTFWAVIVIGGIGLLLAFVQVVLQIVQVAYQFQHPN